MAAATARVESWIWGKWPWGRTNPVVKSEVAVARSRKRTTAMLATARYGIHATATPFSFPAFHLVFFTFYFFPFTLFYFFHFQLPFHLIL